MATALEHIATTTTTTTSFGITLSSIPSTYKDLRVVVLLDSFYAQTVGNLTIRFNDEGGSVCGHAMRWTYQGSYSQDSSFSRDNIQITTTMGDSVMSVIDILDYSNTNNIKTVLAKSSDPNPSDSSRLVLSVGVWNRTNAINRIDIGSQDGSYEIAAGSMVSLYGIKG